MPHCQLPNAEYRRRRGGNKYYWWVRRFRGIYFCELFECVLDSDSVAQVLGNAYQRERGPGV